ncbi:hypothetical protein E4T42_05298 [Aureobasidium subglaciale]|nr:hypothetical protein E4T38_05751 [Aureobasidium subglaciale]KAI5221066.1 hypothetical protein E4T40_05613 [Aureobasidium subglaciale]KAI5224408.1 hypothetical protein E4T41_05730 [Aureobasidium subglaciale]KAI5249620.1 hypothetical protein E4T42_05298 [Aureobasidium subglaciale]KAI5261076.1 hypothetical protein E4T46_05505 [Aureobasidium subglaciale]
MEAFLSETCSASRLRRTCDRAKGHSKVGQLRVACEQRSANAGTSAERGAEAARLFAHSYSLRLLTGPRRLLPLPFFFLLPTQPTPKSCHHQLNTPCVCLASDHCRPPLRQDSTPYTLQRSPAFRIRLEIYQEPATFRPSRQFMYSSRRSQRLAVPDPPKLQPFRILRRPCSNQLTND